MTNEYRIPADALRWGNAKLARSVLMNLTEQGMDKSNAAAFAHAAANGSVPLRELMAHGKDVAGQLKNGTMLGLDVEPKVLAKELFGNESPVALAYASRMMELSEKHGLHPTTAAIAITAEDKGLIMTRANEITASNRAQAKRESAMSL